MSVDLTKPISANNPSGTPVTLLTDAAGNLKVAESSGSSSNPNGQATMANSAPVAIASDQSTLPVSATTLPLPTGAATAAKQPALGTAGSASTDVLSVQGITSMTPLKVDGSATTQPVSGTFWQATQPVSGTVSTTPPANASTNIAQVAGTATDVNSGLKSAGTQRVVLATDQPQLTNALKVDGSAVTQPVSGTVSANASQTGTWTVQPGNTANSTPWLFTQAPTTSGGVSNFFSGTLTTTVTSVKSTAGQIYGWSIANTGTAGCFVQLFNLATGSVTLGTTAPTNSIYIPAGGGSNIAIDNGLPYGTAISAAVTTTYNGSTAASTLPVINLFYK